MNTEQMAQALPVSERLARYVREHGIKSDTGAVYKQNLNKIYLQLTGEKSKTEDVV